MTLMIVEVGVDGTGYTRAARVRRTHFFFYDTSDTPDLGHT